MKKTKTSHFPILAGATIIIAVIITVVLINNGHTFQAALRLANTYIPKPQNNIETPKNELRTIPENISIVSNEPLEPFKNPPIINKINVANTESLSKLTLKDFDPKRFTIDKNKLQIAKPTQTYTAKMVVVETTDPNHPIYGTDNEQKKFWQEKYIPYVEYTFLNATNFLVALDISENIPTLKVPIIDEDAQLCKNCVSEYYKQFPEDDTQFLIFVKKNVKGFAMSQFISVVKNNFLIDCYTPQDGSKTCTNCLDQSKTYQTNGKLLGFVTLNVGPKFPIEPEGKKPVFLYTANGGGLQYLIPDLKIESIDKIYQDAYNKISQEIGFDYFSSTLFIHELSHYWVSHFSKFPFSDGAHYTYAVQSENGSDPHGAFKYQISGDKKVKMCLSDMYPMQPLKFHPFSLYAMGLEKYLNTGKKYTTFTDIRAIAPFNEFTVTNIQDDCIELEAKDPLNSQQFSISDIKNAYKNTAVCEANFQPPNIKFPK